MTRNTTFLQAIQAAKKQEVLGKQRAKPYAQLQAELRSLEAFKGPGFFDVLKAAGPKPRLIAEVKKASPSEGVIRPDLSLADINDAYQAAPNVVAISILTERQYFQGSEEIFSFFARHNTHLKPLLRKDFIFDSYQVLESKLLGAQAYLLIAALFDNARELDELIRAGQEIGLEPLVEVHDRRELELVQSTAARAIGVNCRDLRDFSLDTEAHELLRELNSSYARIAESGIADAKYLTYVSGFADAALVGTNLMKAPDITAAIQTLVIPVVASKHAGVGE